MGICKWPPAAYQEDNPSLPYVSNGAFSWRSQCKSSERDSASDPVHLVDNIREQCMYMRDALASITMLRVLDDTPNTPIPLFKPELLAELHA